LNSSTVLVAENPEVTLAWLPYLVHESAISPRSPATPDEWKLLSSVLGQKA
jgi:hypothetical protein